jgi:hypothetical protein
MKIQIDAFLRALVFLAIIGTAAGIVIDAVTPAHAFCGAMKKDPQPNYATADCK